MDSVLDRIKKLHAMAESAKAIGSVEEAATFAAKVSDLLDKHKLDLSVLSDVAQAKEKVEETMFDWQGYPTLKKRSTWREALVNAVAMHHYCRILVMQGTTDMLIIGKESDRKVVEYLAVALIRKAEQLADAGAKAIKAKNLRLNGSQSDNGWRKSFLHGFVEGVFAKLKEAKAKTMADGGQMALVLRDAMTEVQDYMNKRGGTRKLPAVRRNISNSDGFSRGFQAGSNASVGSGIGTGTNRKVIGA